MEQNLDVQVQHLLFEVQLLVLHRDFKDKLVLPPPGKKR